MKNKRANFGYSNLGVFLVRFFISTALVFIAFVFFVAYSDSATGIPSSINYQGKLLDSSGVAVADGTQSMKFTLYDSLDGGNCLWVAAGACDATSTAVSVTTTNGVFSLQLGGSGHNSLATSSIDFNTDSLYLAVSVDSDPEMSPRKQLVTVPYAFNSDTVDGIHATSTAATASYLLALDANGNFDLFDGGVSSTFATTTSLYVGNGATSTQFLWLGDGGTASSIDLQGGDLFVQGDGEFNGSLYIDTDLVTSGNATTTGQHVFGTGGAGDSLIEFDDNGTLAYILGNDDSTNLFTIATSTLLEVNTLFTLDSNGNATSSGRFVVATSTADLPTLYVDSQVRNAVGISTTTPGNIFGEVLTVVGDSYFTGTVTSTSRIVAEISSGSGDLRDGIVAKSYDANNPVQIKAKNDINDHVLIGISGSGETGEKQDIGFLTVSSGQDLTLWVDNGTTEGLRVKNTTGAVGISTTTPGGSFGEILTVSGDSYFEGNATTSGNLAVASTTSALPALAVDSTNNWVGIGANPSLVKLLIGLASTNNPYSSGSTDDIGLALQNTNNTDGNFELIAFSNAAGNSVAHIGSYNASQAGNTGQLFFSTRPAGGSITDSIQLFIDSTGSVGVNTTTPGGTYGEILTVSGNSYQEGSATTTGNLVIGSPTSPNYGDGHINAVAVYDDGTLLGPDYVFEPGYDLLSIEQMTEFYTTYLHLPWATSRAQLQDQNISLGQRVNETLESTENLAIYISELNSRINTLESASPNSEVIVRSSPGTDYDTLSVQKAATFYGTILVKGEGIFESKITFKQDVSFEGHLLVDNDTAGTAIIPAGATSTEVLFETAYNRAPKVVVNQIDGPGFYLFKVIEKTINGFRVVINETQDEDVGFDWIALANNSDTNSSNSYAIEEWRISQFNTAQGQETELWVIVSGDNTNDLKYAWSDNGAGGQFSGNIKSGLVFYSNPHTQEVEIEVRVYDDASDLIATTTVSVIGTSADVAQGDEPVPTPEDENSTTTEELAQDEPAPTPTDDTIVVEANPPATTTSEVEIGSLNEEGGSDG